MNIGLTSRADTGAVAPGGMYCASTITELSENGTRGISDCVLVGSITVIVVLVVVLPVCLLLLLLVGLGVLVMVMRNWVRNWVLSGSVQPTTPVVALVPPTSLAGASTRGAAAVCARKHRKQSHFKRGHPHPAPATSLTRTPSPHP